MWRVELCSHGVICIIERILSKHDDVKKNTQRPHLKLRALIGATLENLRRAVLNSAIECREHLAWLVECSRTKINQLAVESVVNNYILILVK